jgi:hypothetical protein
MTTTCCGQIWNFILIVSLYHNFFNEVEGNLNIDAALKNKTVHPFFKGLYWNVYFAQKPLIFLNGLLNIPADSIISRG